MAPSVKPTGWHRADIVAAVRKRGSSLAELARGNGLHEGTLHAALGYPRKPSNAIIAAFIGKSLHELWPDWFDASGNLIIRSRTRSTRGRSIQKRRRNLTLTRKKRLQGAKRRVRTAEAANV